MSLLTRLFGKIYKFPPAETYHIICNKNLEVPMEDGVVLLADHYAPRDGEGHPTILLRTPYGRAGSGFMAQMFAERGFQAVLQSCRGTDGSGGERRPFQGEKADGLATLAWLAQQPWFHGRLGMAGPSYLGFTQWAVAGDAGPSLQAICPMVTSTEFYSPTYQGGSFALGTWLQWLQTTQSLEGSMWKMMFGAFSASRRLKRAFLSLPLSHSRSLFLALSLSSHTPLPLPLLRDRVDTSAWRNSRL